MANFARIQNRIYYGYGKAAIRLGTSHAVYRSSNGITPIQSGNLLGSQLVSMDTDLKYTKSRAYGDYTWYFLPQDGQGTTLFALQNYDYMVGGTTTYFIIDILPDDRLSPPICVECNAIISIVAPTSSLTPGINPYQQYQVGVGTQILLNCPASITANSGKSDNNLKLPTSCRLPFYNINIPDFDDVLVQTGDVLTDDSQRTMIIVSAERTKNVMGFRLIAAEVAT